MPKWFSQYEQHSCLFANHSFTDVFDEPGQTFLETLLELGGTSCNGPLSGLNLVDLQQIDNLS